MGGRALEERSGKLVFGMIEALLSFMRRQVGLRTDTADPAGSLHAKVKYLNDTQLISVRDNINSNVNSRQKPRTPLSGSFNTNSATYVTALSVSGKGRLVRIRIRSSNSDGNAYCVVRLDGKSFSFRTTSTSFVEFNPFGTSGGPFDLNFNSSLQIQIKNQTGTYYTYVRYVYEIE